MMRKTVNSVAADEVIGYATGRCALGEVLVAQSARGVCAILLGGTAATLVRELRRRFAHAHCREDAAVRGALKKVIVFLDAPHAALDLPLDLRGTPFQRAVWKALRAVPPGRTVSYAELARRIGRPRAMRAVGAACGANALAVAVPCHRAVRSDGGLAGYRWGLTRKRALLAREAGSPASRRGS